jgi:hypothetical protein
MENVSHADMLKVIIGSSVAAFAALEPFMLLTRRSGIPCEVEDVECGQPNAVFEPLLPIPEKQLEKQCVFVFFSVKLALSESQVF